jgi:sialate O-acetylesterase
MTHLQSRLQRFAEPGKRLTDKRAGWRGGAVLLAALAAAITRAPVPVAQAVVPPNVQSAVRPSFLHEVFRDHAVLQRDRPIAVWGQAAGGEVVTLLLQPSLTAPAVSTVRAQADASGRWNAVLPPMGAGGPFVLAAEGSSGTRQAASDVLIGDVFLCSGQSNMEMSVLRAASSDAEIKGSTNNTIRLLSIEHDINPMPLQTFRKPVAWKSAAPETVPDWSAVCYFFARELQAATHVPIGLLQSAWGGANIRPWMSAPALQAHGGYESGLSLLKLYAREPAAAQGEFAQQWEQWWRDATGEHRGAEPWSIRPVSASPAWRTAPSGLGDWRNWVVPELASFSGSLWYRTRITLSAAQAKSPATLSLGPINQVDETWINGHALGNTFGYETERTYAVPPGVLHAGENVLVVNVVTTYGAGGLLGDGTKRALRLAGGQAIPLDGAWQYRIVPSSIGYPPRTPWESVGGMSTIYNAMVAPLGPYGLRGVLWYQGESNTSEAQTYRSLLEALMADWRRQFGADLPFLIVQLPNYGPPVVTPVESGWADVREAERRAVADDPHAGLAVAIDIGDPRNLHPPNKQDVGKRLARAARHVIFGDSSPPSGPAAVSAVRSADRVAVEFVDIESGLVTYSHASPIGFELCADSPGSCKFAEAQVEGSRVWLAVPPESPPPARVRYCWGDSPVCTLFDGSGLPAGPFELRVVSPPVHLSSEQDHARTMALLHIESLRRGPDGDPTSSNAANFDESKVNPNLRLPDPLVLNDGRRVKTGTSWWRQRRPEILEAFDKEVYGRVPPDVPRVIWRVMPGAPAAHWTISRPTGPWMPGRSESRGCRATARPLSWPWPTSRAWPLRLSALRGRAERNSRGAISVSRWRTWRRPPNTIGWRAISSSMPDR